MQFSYSFNEKIKLGGLSPRFKILASRVVSSLLIAFIAAIGTNLIVRAAPTILATMTAAFIGGDGDGKADPGETIEYTAVIQNNGSDATGVTFNDIIDLNTTLVNGSLNVSPLAIDDTYDTIGNTLLEVGVTASGNPAVRVTTPAIDSLFDNDTEFLGDTFTLKFVEAISGAGPVTAATESGGSVTVQANGNFSYTPPVGFSGSDHFDYLLTDDGPDNILGNPDDLTGAGRVTINVNTQRVWYVKNDATAGGLGRSIDPFDTLAEAQTASAANDTIYVFTGSGTTGQNAGISLKSGQRLLGEGVALTVPVSVNGGSNPTILRAAGTRPAIGNGAGDAVSLSTVSIGASFSAVEIRGLNISGAGVGSNAVDVTTHSTFSGSFELADNVVSAAGAEGIDVNGGGSGALTVNLHDNTVTASSNGIDIFRAVGAGSVNIVAFDDNTVTGATGGIGINIVGGGVGTVLFDTDPSTATYSSNTVSGGTTLIGSPGAGNGAGTSGMVLSNIRGDLSFTDLDIYTDNGAALSIIGTTSNFLTSGTGSRVTANSGTPTLVAVNGPALSTTQTNINIVPTAFSSTNSTTTGVSLVETSGTFAAPSGSFISNATGVDFFVDGNTISTAAVFVTYPGTITDTSGRLVQIQEVTGGSPTYLFSGAISDSGGTSTGVLLDNNDTATIRFSGGLTLSTGSNTAFSAINGATAVEVCDENPCVPGSTGLLVNTLASTTGTALNIVNTIIGSNNLEFRSISSNGGSNTGIILDTTGSSGGLKVVGDGTNISVGGNNSGGTIANKSGADGATTTGNGIYLNNTSNVVLRRMTINGTNQNFGIRGFRVDNFTLEYSTVNGVQGNSAAFDNYGEGSVMFGDDASVTTNGMTGTGTVTNSIFSGGASRNFSVVNTAGTLNRLTITGSTFGHNQSTGNSALAVEARNAGTVANVTVTGSTFTGSPGDAGNFTGQTGTTMDVVFGGLTVTRGAAPGNAITNNHPNNNIGGSNLTFASQGVMNFHAMGNTMSGANGSAVTFFKASAGTVLNGYFDNNEIGNSAIVNSGSATGNGIYVSAGGTGTMSYTITNNFIHRVNGNFHISADNTGGSYTANFDIRGNLFDTPGAGNAGVIGMTNGSPGSGDTVNVCAVIGSSLAADKNTLTGFPAAGQSIFLGSDGAGAGHTFNLPGLPSSTETAVQNFVAGNNNMGGTVVDAFADAPATFAAFTGTGPNCGTPIAMLPDNNQVVAQNQDETTQIVLAPVTSTSLNSADTFTFSFTSLKLPEQASEIDLANTVDKASTTIGGGKPLFRGERLAPALSGETITVPAFTLPAGKSVTIKFQVTVDNPIDNPMGAAQISNQGTVGYDVAQTKLTDDPSIGGISDPTITLIDRPDTTVSSINRHTPSTTSTNATSVIWRVTFATPVAGLTSSNFSLANTGLTSPSIATVSTVTASPDTQWDVTVNTGTGDGTLGLNMTSDAGLSHDVTVLTFTGQVYTLDLTPPTVTMSSAAPNPTNTSPISVTAQFSETVNNFIATDVVAGNATIGNFIAVDGDTYTFSLTPSGQGLVTADIAASVAQDAAGNNNTAATQFSRTFDSVAPSVTLSSVTSDPTNANPIPATAQFSENVTGFDAGDITPGNATVANFVAVDGDTYTFDLTPLSDGLVTADVAAGVATDAAGNGNTAATQFSRTFDSAGPTVTMSSAAPDPTNTSPIPVTTQFSENVTGFDAGDITPGNATVSNFIAVDGDTYTFDLTPGGQGLVTADIAAGVAQDSGGNGNSAATQFTRTFDSVGPTVAMSSAAPDPTNTSPIPVTVQFSENVTGFDAGDITAGNATVGNFIAVDGDTYTFDLTPSAPGLVTADIGAGVATDTAGNGNTAAAQFSRTFDSDAPTVAMSSAATDPTNTSLIPVTVQFSENVTGFDVGDITPGNATIGNLIAVDGDTYTFDLTPLADGPVTADIAAGVAQDSGGNPNNAATQFSRAFDSVAPTMTLNQAAGQVDPTSSSPINFTVIFNELVSGFGDSAGDVSLSGTAGATTALVTESAPNDGTTYNIAVSGMTVDGNVTASIPTGSALDAAGNANTAVSTSTDDTVTFIADAIPPSVTSVNRADANPTSAASVNFTVTFSESVTGVNTIAPFDDFELTTTGVSGATVSGVSGSGAVYTVTVDTGTGNGTIRLDVLDDDTIIDAASNPLAGGFTSGEVYTIDKNSNVEVTIGGSNVGSYNVQPGQSVSDDSYGINGGPVHVFSSNNLPIFTSQRAIFGSSFNSVVGYPADQLTTDYWFTTYDDLGMTTYLVIGNPDSTLTAQVDVYIAGNKMNATPYMIAPGQRIFPRYGINGGPVHVVSTNGVNIFTSERTKYLNSFNEVMGYPGDQVTTEFWFTSYDDAGMLTYLVIGNPDTTLTAEVDVYIAGNKMNATPYSIAPGQRVFPRYGINGGPLHVVSTNGVNIFASERTKYLSSFNEVTGYPGDQLTTDYWFTSYDDTSMITYLVIGNPDPILTAEVDVYIDGTKMNATPYLIAPGQRIFQRYGIHAGPVRVVSTNGVDIFTSDRSKYLNSFNEILGIANDQLTTDYWFTSLDDAGMDTELVISAP